MHDLSPPPINTLDRGRGISPAPGAGFQSAEPAGELAGSTRARTARRNHRPATTATTDTVTKEPPTARHTVPATVGTHQGGAELRCPAAARRTAPATSTPSPSSRNNSAATVVGAQALPRPIPTSSRPSTSRQDRHNLELGPVGPAGQALLAAGRVRLDGDGDGDMAARTPTPPRSARRGDFPASAQ